MAASIFPRQDIPLYKKDTQWRKSHLDYSEEVLKSNSSFRDAMTLNYLSYNGEKAKGSTAWLERTYGKQNKTQFKSFRVGRTKMNLLHGEFLKSPMAATVTTINSDAMSAKMKQQDFMLGAMISKDVLDVYNKAGVDLMEGAPVPKDEHDPIWLKMSPKDKEEDTMQIILDEEMKSLNLKGKVSTCFLDLLITSMCYAKVEIDETGETRFHRIDPRDAIFIHIEGDDYLERSPVRGCRQVKTVNEILLTYTLSDTDRKLLEAARSNPEMFVQNSRGYARVGNSGEVLVDVIHIEWDSVEASYQKMSPRTATQMEIDPYTQYITMDVKDTEKFERDMEVHLKNQSDGKYKISTKWRKVIYEATRIGGQIDVNMRERYFQKRDEDKPTEVQNYSYYGYVHGRVDGKVISTQQVISTFDDMYDIVMYQINKDLARAKGKALFYDRAGMPGDMKMKDVIYRIINDGIIDVNSSAAGATGNAGARNFDTIVNAIKEIDLGLSQSFEYLVNMKNQIVNDLNQITGINENRQGDIAASSTAQNANSAIAASRTITYPLFYGFDGFTRKVVQGVVDTAAVSWAYYKIEKGEQILGTDKHKYLQVTKNLGRKNYGVHIEDGGKYAEMKQAMKEAMMISLNAKELRPIDFYNVSVAETMAQAKTILESSWAELQKAVQQSNQENNRVQMEMQQRQLRGQVDIANADREDRQQQDLTKIQAQGQMDIIVNKEKAKDEMFRSQLQSQNDILNSAE